MSVVVNNKAACWCPITSEWADAMQEDPGELCDSALLSRKVLIKCRVSDVAHTTW